MTLRGFELGIPRLVGWWGRGAFLPRPTVWRSNLASGRGNPNIFELGTMAIEVLDLPKTGSYVEVAILDGGGMIGSSKIMHAEWPDDRDVHMSCWVFYIHHPKSGKKVVWDVGISAVYSYIFRLSD
jgi:hypothetical protein